MKLASLIFVFSIISVSANQCGEVSLKRYNYKCELVNFKTDAVFDTVASHISGRLFSRDNTDLNEELTEFSVVFAPEETTYPSDTFQVNEKGKFGKWLSSHENTFFIHILRKNKKIASLPEQRINSGTAYWADIQVKKQGK